ncbi:MAG: hypothetical protein R6U52_05590 [Kosmotogaceae bacterium]
MISSLYSIRLLASENPILEYGYTINCACYTNNFNTSYRAIGFSTEHDPTGALYLFEFEDQGGDLDIYSFEEDLKTGDWFWGGFGYYTEYPYNEYKDINL